jgi:hypothetical protein
VAVIWYHSVLESACTEKQRKLVFDVTFGCGVNGSDRVGWIRIGS